MRPCRFSVSGYIACPLFGSLTSAPRRKGRRTSAAVFSPASRPTSATQTRAPAAENRIAASRPMPPAAPVMTATFPSSLPTLEEPLPLIRRDDLVEQRLLRARVVQVVVDHVLAERGARHLAFLQRRDRVAQRVRESLDVGLAVEPVAVILPQARVDVARAADPAVVGLRHERHGAALLVGHLLDPVLVDGVVVGHRQRVGEPEVDLLLARPGLALGALDWNTGRLHPFAHRA